MQLLRLLAKLPTSLLITSLALAASALPVESVELTVLTPDNFADTVAHGAWFVEHFSPYCPHCRAFAPTWEKLVQHYDALDDSGVHFAQINCAANGDLCNKNGVTGYPQMMMFKNGEVAEQFKGSRDWDKLISFVDRYSAHIPSKETDKVEAVKESQDEVPLAQSQQKPLPNPEGMVRALDPTIFSAFLDEGPAFIKFYAPWCGHCKKLAPTWTQLAAQFRNKLNVAEVNCDLYKSLCTKEDVKGFPTLFYYSGGSGDGKHKTEYTGGRKIDQLRRFAEMAVAPPLQEIESEAEYEHYVKEFPVVYLFLHSPNDNEALNELKEASQVLLGTPKIITSTSSELRHRFSLPEPYTSPSTPILLSIKDHIPHTYTALFSFTPRSPSSSVSRQKKVEKEKEILKEWLVNERVPSVVELGQETFQDVMSAPNKPLVVIATFNPENEGGVKERMKDVGRYWRSVLERERVVSVTSVEDWDAKRSRAKDVVFAWMDGEKWGSWMKSMYGVTTGNGETSVVIADHSQLIYYDTNAKGNKIAFEMESITSAVRDVLSGKVPYKNSENIFERIVRKIESAFTSIETFVSSHPYLTIFIFILIIIGIIIAIRRVLSDDYSSSYASGYEYTRLQKEPGRLD